MSLPVWVVRLLPTLFAHEGGENGSIRASPLLPTAERTLGVAQEDRKCLPLSLGLWLPNSCPVAPQFTGRSRQRWKDHGGPRCGQQGWPRGQEGRDELAPLGWKRHFSYDAAEAGSGPNAALGNCSPPAGKTSTGAWVTRSSGEAGAVVTPPPRSQSRRFGQTGLVASRQLYAPPRNFGALRGALASSTGQVAR